MTTSRYYKYFAFISYSRKDKRFAARLHHALTAFKLPSKLCHAYPDKPERLRPVYLDKTNLVIDQLNAALGSALETSKFLIVICSPNSAKPNDKGKNWVDEEIKKFIDIDPENVHRIIPVIYRKKSVRATACFPPALKELDILGADVADKGISKTFNDVVSKMLGLDPDELWNWWERKERARRRWRNAGIAAAVAAAGFLGWWTWDFYTPRVRYYTDYVEANNIPQGLNELTKEEIQTRQFHYRFTSHRYNFFTRAHRLDTVECCNSAGYLSDGTYDWAPERPAKIALEYKQDNRTALYQHHFDNKEKKLVTLEFKGLVYITYTATKQNEQIGIIPSHISQFMISLADKDNLNSKKTDVTKFQVQRDEKGLIEWEKFIDTYGEPAQNQEGAWGRLYKRDEKGRVIRMLYTDQEGNPQATRTGLAGYAVNYDRETGLATDISYINQAGELWLNSDKIAKIRFEQEKGNIIKESYYSTDSKNNAIPCLHKDGYASAKATHDSRGNIITVTYFNIDGKPCFHKDGYASFKMFYDNKGNIIKASYFDIDNKPCFHKNGSASLKMVYDDKRNIIKTTCLDIDGNPCLIKDGYASFETKYNHDGNKTRETYFGVDGYPCLTKDGYASINIEYDKNGNRITDTYYDTDGKPCLNRKGFASIQNTYDEKGHITWQSYFGIDDNKRVISVSLSEGFASTKHSYDSRGNCIQEEYFSTTPSTNNGNPTPCLNKNGIASVKFLYDNKGNMVKLAYYGLDLDKYGNPLPCYDKNGVAAILFSYDNKGLITRIAIFGLDDKGNSIPRLDKDGVFSQERKYDDKGNKIKESYFRFDDRGHSIPCSDRNGVACVESSYDSYGNMIKASFLDINGNPCLSKDLGYASSKLVYDNRGNQIKQAYFGTDGLPCISKDGIASWEMSYDVRGNLVKTTYFGLDCLPCLHKDLGVASMEISYDDKGNLVKQVKRRGRGEEG